MIPMASVISGRSSFGERLFWKIDYYHPERDEHSPVKWSAELTRRVVTIMLASEY
ncbi:DUF3768 domain-containing protein (plasmid) [Caulobacter sp. FWC26]|nr:DUF3768 domain-containing protein [Caulobacter sp. FWC26]